MSPVQVSSVAFDFDGVIADSGDVIERSWHTVLNRYGVTVTRADVTATVHGRTGRETLQLLAPGLSPERARALWAEVDQLEEQGPFPLLPGARDLLLGLSAARVPLALVTSSWTAKVEKFFEQHELGGVFDVVITRDDVTRGKPAPEPYLAAADRLGVDARAMLVFEDSAAGTASALAAACPVIGVGPVTQPGVSFSVGDLGDLDLRADEGAVILAAAGHAVRISRP